MYTSQNLKIVFAVILALVATVIVFFKGLTLPVTHDEPSTLLHYCRYGVWEIMMYPDPWPNNHILCTLLAKLSMSLFGMEIWAGRLPVMLSFLLYLYAALRISHLLFEKSSLLFAASFSFFIFNPYLLDFFSLSRGYGLSNALMLTSVMWLLEGFRENRQRAVWLSLLFAILASYANFTLLIYWGAISIMTGLFFLHQFLVQKQTGRLLLRLSALLAIDSAYFALIYPPIHKMQSTNQFVYWESNGFFRDTVVSVVDTFRYGGKMLAFPHTAFAWVAVAMFAAAAGFCMLKLFRKCLGDWMATPLCVSFLILGLTVVVNIVQIFLLKTPGLTGRTALSYYPLFVFLSISLLHELSIILPRLMQIASVAVLLVLLLHMAQITDLSRTREWYFDAHAKNVMQVLQKESQNKGPLTFQTAWELHRSFEFYTQTGKANWILLEPYPENHQIDTMSEVSYYYIFNHQYPLLEKNFEIIEQYDGGSYSLLRRK